MAYTKNLRAVVPVAPGDDVEVLRWLTRESFETTAGSQGLAVVEYAESILSLDQVLGGEAEGSVAYAEKLRELDAKLPLPIEQYEWREFTAVAAVSQQTVDWLVAESDWRKGG